MDETKLKYLFLSLLLLSSYASTPDQSHGCRSKTLFTIDIPEELVPATETIETQVRFSGLSEAWNPSQPREVVVHSQLEWHIKNPGGTMLTGCWIDGENRACYLGEGTSSVFDISIESGGTIPFDVSVQSYPLEQSCLQSGNGCSTQCNTQFDCTSEKQVCDSTVSSCNSGCDNSASISAFSYPASERAPQTNCADRYRVCSTDLTNCKAQCNGNQSGNQSVSNNPDTEKTNSNQDCETECDQGHDCNNKKTACDLASTTCKSQCAKSNNCDNLNALCTQRNTECNAQCSSLNCRRLPTDGTIYLKTYVIPKENIPANNNWSIDIKTIALAVLSCEYADAAACREVNDNGVNLYKAIYLLRKLSVSSISSSQLKVAKFTVEPVIDFIRCPLSIAKNGSFEIKIQTQHVNKSGYLVLDAFAMCNGTISEFQISGIANNFSDGIYRHVSSETIGGNGSGATFKVTVTNGSFSNIELEAGGGGCNYQAGIDTLVLNASQEITNEDGKIGINAIILSVTKVKSFSVNDISGTLPVTETWIGKSVGYKIVSNDAVASIETVVIDFVKRLENAKMIWLRGVFLNEASYDTEIEKTQYMNTSEKAKATSVFLAIDVTPGVVIDTKNIYPLCPVGQECLHKTCNSLQCRDCTFREYRSQTMLQNPTCTPCFQYSDANNARDNCICWVSYYLTVENGVPSCQKCEDGLDCSIEAKTKDASTGVTAINASASPGYWLYREQSSLSMKDAMSNNMTISLKADECQGVDVCIGGSTNKVFNDSENETVCAVGYSGPICDRCMASDCAIHHNIFRYSGFFYVRKRTNIYKLSAVGSISEYSENLVKDATATAYEVSEVGAASTGVAISCELNLDYYEKTVVNLVAPFILMVVLTIKKKNVKSSVRSSSQKKAIKQRRGLLYATGKAPRSKRDLLHQKLVPLHLRKVESETTMMGKAFPIAERENPVSSMKSLQVASSSTLEGAKTSEKLENSNVEVLEISDVEISETSTSSEEEEEEEEHIPIQYRLIHASCIVCFFSYIGLCNSIFSLLNCKYITSLNKEFIEEDTRFECNGSRYDFYRTLAIILIPVVVIGIPLLGIFVPFKFRDRLEHPHVFTCIGFIYVGYRTTSSSSGSNEMAIGDDKSLEGKSENRVFGIKEGILENLAEKSERRTKQIANQMSKMRSIPTYWYEAVFSWTKICFSLISTFLAEAELQCFWAILVVVLNLLLQLYCKPYRRSDLNVLQEISLTAILFSLFYNLQREMSARTDNFGVQWAQDLFLIILLISNGIFALFLVGVFVSKNIKDWLKMAETMKKKIVKKCCCCCLK
eukprot:g6228.t1